MSINITGDIGKIEVDLKNKINSLNNIDKVLGRIAQDMKKETQLNFRNSTAPDGTKWKPISPITKSLRKKASDKPLVDRGTLRRSIRATVEGNQAIIGTNLKYAKIHQYGGTIKPRSKEKLKEGETAKKALSFGGKVVKKVVIPSRAYIGVNRNMLQRYKKWLLEK